MDTATAPPTSARHDRRIERRFDRLPASYVVHREVRVPGRTETIDHVVLGTTGAFAIRGVRFARDVTIRGADARSDGRSLQTLIDDHRADAHALGRRLEVEVRPIVVVHGARLRVTGLFSTSVVHGVRFCEPNKLPGVLTTHPCSLTTEAVGHLSARLREL